MKWLVLIFSILKPFFPAGESSKMMNPIAELKEMIKANAVKVVLLFTCASALSSMFAAGLIIVAIDIGAQFDQNGYVYFSSMIAMGLVLTLIPVLVGAVGVRLFQNDAKKEREREVLTNVGTSHPLQDALALLILDFVKERELRRSAEEKESYGETPYREPMPEERVPTDMPRH